MTRCEAGVHSRRGRSAATSCSILSGSACAVQPNLRASRAKWVSTVRAGLPNASPSTTLAVLRPTPGNVTSSSSVPGTSPPNRSHRARPRLVRVRALDRKYPVGWISFSSSAWSAPAWSAAVRYRPNSTWVTWLTPWSVVWADRIVATRSSSGDVKFSSIWASGYIRASSRLIRRARRTSAVGDGAAWATRPAYAAPGGTTPLQPPAAEQAPPAVLALGGATPLQPPAAERAPRAVLALGGRPPFNPPPRSELRGHLECGADGGVRAGLCDRLREQLRLDLAQAGELAEHRHSGR